MIQAGGEKVTEELHAIRNQIKGAYQMNGQTLYRTFLCSDWSDTSLTNRNIGLIDIDNSYALIGEQVAEW